MEKPITKISESMIPLGKSEENDSLYTDMVEAFTKKFGKEYSFFHIEEGVNKRTIIARPNDRSKPSIILSSPHRHSGLKEVREGNKMQKFFRAKGVTCPKVMGELPLKDKRCFAPIVSCYEYVENAFHLMKMDETEAGKVGKELGRLHKATYKPNTGDKSLSKEAVKTLDFLKNGIKTMEANIQKGKTVWGEITSLKLSALALARDRCPKGTCHNDIKPLNILWRLPEKAEIKGGKVSTENAVPILIDFDHTSQYAYFTELCNSAEALSRTNNGVEYIKSAAGLIKGYEKERPLTPLEKELTPLIVEIYAFERYLFNGKLHPLGPEELKSVKATMAKAFPVRQNTNTVERAIKGNIRN